MSTFTTRPRSISARERSSGRRGPVSGVISTASTQQGASLDRPAMLYYGGICEGS